MVALYIGQSGQNGHFKKIIAKSLLTYWAQYAKIRHTTKQGRKARRELAMKKYDVDYQGGESRYGIEPVDYMLVRIDDTELYAEAPAQDDENANYDDLKAAILEQAAENDIPAEWLKFWDEM